METDKKNQFAIIYIVLSACFFALGGILIKINTWSSNSINGMRCLFAFLVMFTYMKVRHHHFTINKSVILCAAANYGMSLTFVIANKMTSAANAIVLQFTMPVFIIILQFIIWKMKPDRFAVIACAASFAGIICFFLDSLTASGMAGNCLAVFSGFLYAIVFLSKKIKGCDFSSAMLISFAFAFFSAIPSIAAESSIGGINLMSVIALGVVQQGFSYICLDRGLDHVAPVTASLTSMLEPILNPILVAIFYGETIGPVSLVGAVIVLSSATFYNLITIRRGAQAG